MMQWLKDVAIRTIKTMGETAIGLIGAQIELRLKGSAEVASASFPMFPFIISSE